MGLFDSLVGRTKKPRFETLTPFELIPTFLNQQGRRIGQGAFDVFEDLITQGETDAAAQLFNRGRTRTIQGFEDAVENASLNLNRAGLGSSGARDRSLAALALSFGDTLAARDAARSESLRAQQSAGAAQGLNAINSLARGAAFVPITRHPGLFDDLGTRLIGLGVSGVIGGLSGGIGGLSGGGGGGFGQNFGQGFSDAISGGF